MPKNPGNHLQMTRCNIPEGFGLPVSSIYSLKHIKNKCFLWVALAVKELTNASAFRVPLVTCTQRCSNTQQHPIQIKYLEQSRIHCQWKRSDLLHFMCCFKIKIQLAVIKCNNVNELFLKYRTAS